MHSTLKRGFTLIELLVVIAIIGILSAVVLASLNTARFKGSDAAIQADLSGIRTQAQLYLTNNSSYGPVVTEVTSDCTASAGNLFADSTILKQTTAANAANGPTDDAVCNVAANGTAYAVSVALVATPSTFFCVDSTGVATTTTAALAVDATSC